MALRNLRRLLALCLLLIAAASAEEEEKPQSKVSVAIAATLMGSISFQMSLYYFTNWPDADVKRYSWEVISSTISIFCSVLVFQSFNDLISLVVEGRGLWAKLAIDSAHMLFWYALLQIALALIAGIHTQRARDEKSTELNMKCWAVLLAHLTGFAATNAWGDLQHMPFFRASPWRSFLVVPVAFFFQLMLQRVTDAIREWISLKDDDFKDPRETIWDEQAEESEDDVLGLSLSFLLTQAFRFLISGTLASTEGIEGAELFQHGLLQPLLLLAVAVGFAFLCALTIFWLSPIVEGFTHSPSATRSPAESSPSSKASTPKIPAMTRSRVFLAHLAPSVKDIAERFKDALLVVGSMGFAWCAFFAAKWALANVRALQDDPMLLGVVLALIISFTSFTIIIALDWVADRDWTPDKVQTTVKQLIAAVGILVGFSWEQCFDGAVESLASVENNVAYHHVLKLALTLFCVGILVPAWRLYMLPMVIREGWRFGFVIDHELMADVVKHLKEPHDRKDAEQTKKSMLIHDRVVRALEAEFVHRRSDWHRSESLENVLSSTQTRPQLSRGPSRRDRQFMAFRADFRGTQSEGNYHSDCYYREISH